MFSDRAAALSFEVLPKFGARKAGRAVEIEGLRIRFLIPVSLSSELACERLGNLLRALD
jgi:hypothetical protein